MKDVLSTGRRADGVLTRHRLDSPELKLYNVVGSGQN